MTTAKKGDTVRVDYVGKLQDGTVFDSSEGRQPLEFTLGASMVIEGFDEAVTGMSVGETITAEVPADEAYGEANPELRVAVPKDQFPEDMELEEGQRLQLRQPSGEAVAVTVREVGDEQVVLDANHPLAGENLTFDIALVEVVGRD